nr:KleE stable inheritance protein [Salmonella enterica]
MDSCSLPADRERCHSVFKMMFKWSDGPFAAAWPFVISFFVLAALTYIMATWKPKAP